MQTVFNGIDCSQLLRKLEWFKRKYGEGYSPFAGRKTPVVSMEDVKRLLSLPENVRQNYFKRLC